MIVTNETNVVESRELLDVNQLSKILNCSTRHIYRLTDAGKMPRPLKLGALVRWPKNIIEKWIAEGCPACRKV